MADDYVIEMLNITKEFPGIKANDDVTLQLRRGEIHALLGENGAGKSTLIKIIAGVEQPDPGSVLYFEGRRAAKLTPQKAIQKGVAVIYQDISLFPNLTVA